MPMLDDSEYAEILELYRQCAIATKEFRKQWELPLHDIAVQERFEPLRRRYEELTGVQESNQNAIMHHRLSLYGPPCKECGKPLRTPKAKLCGACMAPVES
jgi:hypothetical protein